MLTYCPNLDCPSEVWENDANYCPNCGTKMNPCIRCLCRQEWYNPRRRNTMPRFCPFCGREFTEAYIGECMRTQLKEITGNVAEELRALSE